MKKEINFTLQSFKSIGKGKVKVQVSDRDTPFEDMNLYGKKYIVTKRLSRGRYIIREKQLKPRELGDEKCQTQ